MRAILSAATNTLSIDKCAVEPNSVTYTANYGNDPIYGGTRRGQQLDPLPLELPTAAAAKAPQPPTTIRLRGLPWRASREQILKVSTLNLAAIWAPLIKFAIQFFHPLEPIEIELLRDELGRPNGSAKIEFATFAQAKEALKKNRQFLGSRWVELQLVNGERMFMKAGSFETDFSCSDW